MVYVSHLKPTAISLISITLLILNPLTPINLLNLNLAAAAQSLQTECEAELVAFSPCLPFVSEPPNNFAAVSQKCCDAIIFPFNSTARSSDSCICHLLRQPQIFGFALNLSRVLSLPSVCLGKNTRSPEPLSICSSVEFSEKSVSELEEAIRKCDKVINGGCTNEQCCWNLCEKRLPYAKTMDVSYKAINGAHLCYCHAIYQNRPSPCMIKLNF